MKANLFLTKMCFYIDMLTDYCSKINIKIDSMHNYMKKYNMLPIYGAKRFKAKDRIYYWNSLNNLDLNLIFIKI